MKSDRKILATNGAWSLVNQLARVGTLAIVMIALSRHFGPERFGALAFGLAFVRIFAVVAGCGLERVIVRQFVETPEDAGVTLRKTFSLKLQLGAATYGCLLLLAFAIAPRNPLTIAIIGIAGGSLIFQAFDVYDYFFQAGNQFRLVFCGRTLPLIFTTGLKLFFVFAHAPLLVFAALETFEAALISFVLFSVHRATRLPANSTPGPAFVDRRAWLRAGFPLLIGSLAVMLYMRSDILILGRLAGFGVAGIYSAAAQVTEACALFPMAFMPALFPMLVRWRRRGIVFYREKFEKLFLFSVIAGLAVALCLTNGAPLLVRLIYGAAYASAAPILIVHASSAIFIYLSILQSGYDITENLTWIAAIRTAAGATLNIALNFAFIPRWGAIGSAAATLISQACSSFLFNFAHPRTRPIFWMQVRALLLLPLVRPAIRFLRPGVVQLASPGSVSR
jgi:PST family polysaccharide transporter